MALDTDFSPAGVLALVSAVVTALAAFLPWATAGVETGPVEISTSAAGIDGLGLVTLILAVVAAAVVLALQWHDTGAAATAVLGLVVGLLGVWKYLDISGVVAPDVGLYLTILGGVGLLVAGLWGYTTAESEPGQETLG